MRPQSIVMFERLFLASLAVSALSFLLNYGQMAEIVASEPTLQQAGLGTGFMIGVTLAGYALYLILWYLIARKAANWAKWVLVVFVALSLISLPGALTGPWNLTLLLGLAVYALEVVAVVHLFRADAAAWLTGKQAADPATFD